MALFISNLVTRPLRTISQNMSDISLGKKNDGLKWDAVDEIGNIVNE